MGNNTSHHTNLVIHPPSESSPQPSLPNSQSPVRIRRSEPDIRATIKDKPFPFIVNNKRLSIVKHLDSSAYESSLSLQPGANSLSNQGSRELDLFSSRNNIGVSSLTEDKDRVGQLAQPVPDEMYTIEDETTPKKIPQESSLVFDFKQEKDGMFSELIGEDHSKKIQADFLKLKEQLKAIHNVSLKEAVKLDCFYQAKNEKIYRVFHKQNRKFYALKVLEITSEEQVISAWEEINSLVKIQNLRNSHLLEVYDIEYYQYDPLSARASLFILRELGAGTLQDYADFKAKSNLEWEEAELLDIFQHIFQQYLILKGQGIFHRDIKPSNIIIPHSFDEVKLVSFRVIHLEHGASQYEQKIFEEELDIVGTPLFQAPEIFTKGGNLKRARYNPSVSDIYSIAITILALYNPSLDKNSILRTLASVRERYPMLHQYLANLLQENPEMRKKMLISLESEHEESFQQQLNILEMRQFNEYMQGKALENLTRENSVMYITTLRNLFLLREAEIVADSMIAKEKKIKAESEEMGKLMYLKGLCMLDSGQCNKAIEEFEAVCLMLERIKQKKSLYMAKTYEALGRAQRSLGKYDEALEALDKSLKIKLKSHTNQHAEIASSYQSIGQVMLSQGKIKDSESYLDKAHEIKTAIFEATHLEMASILESLSSLYENQGKFTKGLDYCKKALAIKVANLGQIHPGVGHIYHLMGSIYERQGKYVEALKELEKSLDIKKKCLGENHLEVALTTNKIGTVYKSLGKYPEALRMFYRSLSTKLQFLGEKHPEVAISYHSIGSLYFVQKQYADALEKFNEAFDINYRYYGEDHITIAYSLLDIASVNQAQLQYPMAIANYQKALRILSKHQQERHANSALIYNNLGAIYEKLGQYNESNDKYKMALEIKLELYGANHPSTAATYNNIGLVLEKQGRFDEALGKLNQALEIKIKHFGEKHPSVASTYNNLGLTYFRQAKPDQALNMYSKALEIKVKLYGEQDGAIADCYYYIGNVYKLQGKKVSAKKSYQQALDIYYGLGDLKNPKVDKVRKQLESLK